MNWTHTTGEAWIGLTALGEDGVTVYRAWVRQADIASIASPELHFLEGAFGAAKSVVFLKPAGRYFSMETPDEIARVIAGKGEVSNE